MKISVCDICYHQKGELKGARFRLSFKKATPYPQRIALDACAEHKDWLKQFKTFEEADKAVGALYMTTTPKPAVTEKAKMWSWCPNCKNDVQQVNGKCPKCGAEQEKARKEYQDKLQAQAQTRDMTEQVPGAAKGGKGYHIAGAGTGGKKSQGFGE